MGGAKEAWHEALAKGFTSGGQTYVCSNCIEDYAIQEFIDAESVSKKCDYCGHESEEDDPIAASLDDVLEFIVEGIQTEWGQPGSEGLGFCSREGGWQGTVYDTWDLLSEVLDIGLNGDGLLKDLVGGITEDEWCEKDPYGERLSDQWFFDWERFSRQVKHKTRYVFFKLPTKADDKEWYQPAENPYEILFEMGDIVDRLELISSLPAGTEILRVRVCGDEMGYKDVAELGPPPVKVALSANRMSPAGISMFYGAFDEGTALAETTKQSDKYATVGVFKTLKDMKVLDLTKLPGIPSMFDRERRHERQAISFMWKFLSDFTKPVEKNGAEHIEYVPTQIVTEYFRHIFTHEEAVKLDGMIYPSAVKQGRNSCVLFCDATHCIQDLIGRKDNHLLSLVSNKIKTVKL